MQRRVSSTGRRLGTLLAIALEIKATRTQSGTCKQPELEIVCVCVCFGESIRRTTFVLCVLITIFVFGDQDVSVFCSSPRTNITVS